MKGSSVHFFMLPAFEHGLEHRTEIKVTLAHLDGWAYAEVQGYGREVR